jgi:phosphoglycerate kinase
MKILKDFNFENKRVLVRCDLNVPLSKEGPACNAMRSIAGREVLDDFRIKLSLPTINYLMERKAKIVLMSHLGRPEGRVVESLKMDPIQNKLMEYLDVSVTKAPDCLGLEIENWTKEMIPGEILLLENLRFHKEEELNDKNFALGLSKLGDIYINDAFGVSHREHASVFSLPDFLPAGAGLLLQREIEELSNLIENPQKPLIGIMAGAKAETKIKAINKIAKVADWILIGGLLDKEITKKNIKLEFPEKIIKPIDEDKDGLDIGLKTIQLFKEKISKAKTVFWNGPFGKTEEGFTKGSEEIARAIIASGAYSIIGGGETIEFVNRIGLLEKFNYISSGGGAMLEFLGGKDLPGIKVLK